MKVLLLGDCNSIHIIKWVKGLHEHDIHLGLFSFSSLNHGHFKNLDKFTFENLELSKSIYKSGEGSFKKLNYLKALPQLKKFIQSFKPDIIHAHYASSYGFVGALCGFHPYIVSVWGSDIYDFPKRNFLFKRLIKYTLEKADQILSTSAVMATETSQYTKQEILVTPFGVDIEKFKKLQNSNKDHEKLVIGTIKALDYKYGVDVLINAFAQVKSDNPSHQLELHIVGEGAEKAKLQAQVNSLTLASMVKFKGKVDNTEVPALLNGFDIYVALSRWDSESFGVAIVEAQACELPVIVSDKGGLPEVVAHGETGIVVVSENASKAAEAMQQLIDSEKLRQSMGVKGRKRVVERYNWDSNLERMVTIYTKILL